LLSSADLQLTYRVEMAEAANIAAIAEAVEASPVEFAVQSFAGGKAVFGGAASPLTHAIGIGLNGPVTEAEMERLEEFFYSRGAACTIDLCTLADITVLAFLQKRPYRIVEFNNVMGRAVDPNEKIAADAGIREVGEAEYDTWARVICGGFSDQMPVMEEMVAVMSATCRVSRCWLAQGGQAEAGAALRCRSGIALFYGDATLPAARGRGWQAALIRSRLLAAQKDGCDFAVACVLPGSISHRNYERAGFQLLYLRVNVTRECPEAI
jgi:GNAT superfamily N-acetyltransferase